MGVPGCGRRLWGCPGVGEDWGGCPGVGETVGVPGCGSDCGGARVWKNTVGVHGWRSGWSSNCYLELFPEFAQVGVCQELTSKFALSAEEVP